MQWFEQVGDQLWKLWLYLTTGRVMAVGFGVAFAVLALSLFVASKTKWGRSKPLTKFVVVSVVLHVWLLMYAVGSVQILPQGDLDGTERGARERTIAVSFAEDSEEAFESNQTQVDPWESSSPNLGDLLPPEVAELDLADLQTEPDPLPELAPMPMPELPPEPAPILPEEVPAPTTLTSDVAPPELEASSREVAATTMENTEFQAVASQASPVVPPEMQLPTSAAPAEYRLRQAPNRLQLARAYGADEDSEAAVAAGLQWLANAQSQDGSWNAAAYGAGTETRALEMYRYGTGSKADTGISGLALLAFLSAGHTHLDGEYRDHVRASLSYLIQSQMPSGDLSGPKQLGSERSVLYARMYCHSIATLALAEAHAMTQDTVIRDALLKAASFSINAQDPRGGGWRYQPRDAGDLSQFGWQAMALKSVQRSGIKVPEEVQRRMRRFLDSCTTGNFGGLATYKPREGRPTATMTAEALACRLLLDYPLSLDAQREAKAMIMRSKPGTEEDNVYFWYYATLALFQLQDEDWAGWNQAMKVRLLQSQIPAYGDQPGSWEPDRLWGGYGGRVYSTAMSCLCLEVYYRYLPMYRRDNLARNPRLDLNR